VSQESRSPYSDAAWQEREFAASGRLADTGRRVVAYIIDVIIVGVIVGVIGVTLEAIGLGNVFSSLVATVLGFGYFIYMEGTTGQTFGKRVMNIRVVTETGADITMAQSAVRNILRIVDTFFFGLIGLILIIFTQKRQRIGDMVAKTIVIEA
jgi:uncharacterized RDD family membrane protein YckC